MTQADADQDSRGPSLIYIVGRLNQGIGRELRALLRRWDLSVQEYTSLSVLELRPGLSNAQLARRALVSPQSMIEILAKLVASGRSRWQLQGSMRSRIGSSASCQTHSEHRSLPR